ncbi:patatin-like phospholipase family protein, partial [Vibrio coralliirubri]|uniref:patatin-like phospholipase family protein n=2 Tax=Vibrio TaxID=662 RepID=UPI002FD55C49
MAKTISLVLGSGGARGLVHVGVIRWLIEHGYQIKSISGCSIGALIGGVYAAGKLDEFEEWVTSIDQGDMAMLLDFSWQSSGIFKGDKIIDTLRGLIGEISIEDLPIPYTAVAANVADEKEVWLQSGSLFDAIRASISLPLFFTP